MIAFSGGIKTWLQKSSCALLKIRAGIFLKPDCLSILNAFLKNYENVRLVIYAYSHDSMPVKDLVTSLNVIGQNNVLLDLPKVLEEKLQALSGYNAVEDVSREDKKFSRENNSSVVCSFPKLSVILALILYFVMN